MNKTPHRRYAVIDIGSNAVRLLIAVVADDGHLMTESFTRLPLALGTSAFNGDRRRIRAGDLRRLCDTVLGMRHFIAAMRPVTWRAVATAALRNAANREQTLAALKTRCQVNVRVLSGREEATTIGRYIAAQFNDDAAVLNLDVGGGSTDCAFFIAGELIAADTFAVGIARPNSGEDDEKQRLVNWLQTLDLPPAAIVTASGGSALSLRHAFGELTAARLNSCRRQLAGMPVTAIAKRYGLSPDRAADSAAAVSIYRSLLQATGKHRLQPAAGGLAEGVIYRLAGR